MLSEVSVMLLSDRSIKTALAEEGLTIEPWDPAMLQPASVDVRLGDSFQVFANHREAAIDPMEDQALMQPVGAHGGRILLHPGEFMLATTLETVTLPDWMAARVEGKSSLGRLGLLTHVTAGFIDPGFTGQITLELANVATLPIVLRPGMKIGQLCFMRLTSSSERPYGSEGLGSRYQGQVGATASRMYRG